MAEEEQNAGQEQDTAKEKPGREIITWEDGRQVYYYPAHGMVKDTQTGQVIVPPKSPFLGDPEKAREIITGYHMAAREAAIAGLGKKGVRGTESALQAWSNIVGAQADLAENIEKGRASTEAARFVGQATGFMSKDGAGSDDAGSGSGLNVTVSAESLRDLLLLVRDLRGVGDA